MKNKEIINVQYSKRYQGHGEFKQLVHQGLFLFGNLVLKCECTGQIDPKQFISDKIEEYTGMKVKFLAPAI